MHQDWGKLECFKHCTSPDYWSVQDPWAASLSYSRHRLTNATSWRCQNDLFQNITEKQNNAPISISEIKPCCYPLNNKWGTKGPSCEGNLLKKNQLHLPFHPRSAILLKPPDGKPVPGQPPTTRPSRPQPRSCSASSHRSHRPDPGRHSLICTGLPEREGSASGQSLALNFYD